tara:strand:+ start:428 stop:5179 length:4752 start_codon:yes stop_codon:yes gene_type:complete
MERSGTDPMFLEVVGLPELLTYGKHYATVSFKDPSDSPYYLRNGSKLSFEVKDSDGNIIFSEIADSNEILDDYQGVALVYIWIKEDPLRTFKDISNGMGTLTFIGELSGVPTEWQNKPNYRCTFPIEIRKELPNTSPILFESASYIQQTFTDTTTAAFHLSTTSSLSESVQLDKGDTNYKRSYLHISASHLKTFGGKVEFVEVAYNENTSFDNEFKNLSTFPLTGSISSSDCTFETSASAGLNPVSIVQSFRLPRDLRRDTNTDFRLRFLNSDMQYVQNLNENKIIAITSSLMISGSPMIIETADNLVTGSGKIMFGKSIEEGVKLEYSDVSESIIMVHRIDGRNKTIKEFAGIDGGYEIGGDVRTQRIEGIASGSAILAGSGSTVNAAIGSTIAGGLNNQIKDAKRSTIVGGSDNRITASMQGTTVYGHDAVIVGGGNNELSGSERSFIGGGENNLIKNSNSATVVAGHRNIIHDNGRSVIVGGEDNQMSGSASAEAYAWNFIGGGKRNRLGVLEGIDEQYSSILGGNFGLLQASYAVLLGGNNNINTSYMGLMGAGRANSLNDMDYSFHLGSDMILGGYGNNIQQMSSYYGSHIILGGYENAIDGDIGSLGDNNGIIATGTSNDLLNAPYGVIVNGFTNLIQGSPTVYPDYSFIGTGISNKILGGSSGSTIFGCHNEISTSRDCHIFGSNITVKSSSAHYQADTVYMNNLIVSGGSRHPIAGTGLFTGDVTILGNLQATQITSSIVSSSILYSSGSNIFGDASTDIHTFNGDVSVSGGITGSNLLITSSTATNVIQIGATGAGGIQKWEWDRDGTRKFVIYNDGRTNAGVPQDSLVFKHGVDSDGDNHINFHMEQDDQSVYFHGGISSSGTIHSETHITASGEISSSGKLFAYGADFGDRDITNVKDIYLDKLIGDGHNDATFTIDSNGYIFNAGEKDLDFKYYDSEEADLIHGDAALSRVGISDTSPVSKLDVGGDLNVQSHITASGEISSSDDIRGKRLYTYGDTSPMVNLKRTDGDNVNAVIQFENGNGSMFVGVDGDAQNAGANIFGVGYAGDLIDNDGSNHATFVVTGSQVVINNATSASSGAALTVGGDITATHITASGVISASGGFVGDGSNITGVTATADAASISGSWSSITSSILTRNAITSSFLVENATTSSFLVTNSDTASFTSLRTTGNISASGDLVLGSTLAANPYLSASLGTLELSGSGDAVLEIQGDISASGNISGSTIFATTFDGGAVSDVLAAAVVTQIDNDEIPIAKLAEDAITIAGTSTALGGSITSAAILNNGKATISGSFENGMIVGGEVSSSGNAKFGSQVGANSILTIGNAITDNSTGTSVASGSQLLIGSEAFASSSIKLLSANKYWEIATSKVAVGMSSVGLHFRLNGVDRHVFDGSGNVGIETMNPTKELTVEGDISGSGEIYAVSASLGSLTNTTNRWQDGWHGNDDFIAITPQDFQLSNDASRGHAIYTDDDGATTRVHNANHNMYAMKIIPRGFTARAVRVNCSVTISSGIIPLDSNISSSVATAHTAGNTNADIDLDATVEGDGANYVVIEFNASATSNEIYGGKIYIDRT